MCTHYLCKCYGPLVLPLHATALLSSAVSRQLGGIGAQYNLSGTV